MGYSGYIDWQRLRRAPWHNTREGSTYVYAFWPVDHGRSRTDHGISLLKAEDSHPDWFLHAEHAGHLLTGTVDPDEVVSPNFATVFTEQLNTRPLLGSLLLATSSATYAQPDRNRYWWCAPQDLTGPGRRLLKATSTLYLRQPVLLTFLSLVPMRQVVPEAPRDPATVAGASGPHL